MDCKSIYEGLIPSALSNNPTTMEIAMSHPVNDSIREDLYQKLGELTVNQLQDRCETYGLKQSVSLIDSIIEILVEKKMENECE